MKLILVILLILTQREGFSTRGPRWQPFDHTSPVDDIRTRGVILKAEHSFGDCPIYPLLVFTCRGEISGIMVALPGAAFSQENPSTAATKAQVRLRWDRGVPVSENWTFEPPNMTYPQWRTADHLKQLEQSDRLTIEFRLYGQGMVFAEFDLSEKEPVLEIIRTCGAR